MMAVRLAITRAPTIQELDELRIYHSSYREKSPALAIPDSSSLNMLRQKRSA